MRADTTTMASSLLDLALPTDRPGRRTAWRRQQTLWRWGTTAGACWRPGDSPDAPLLGRVARCGRYGIGGGPVALRRSGRGHYVASVQRCGSIWACPVCAPLTRWRREQALTAALVRLQAERAVVLRLVTLTVPHRAGDPLEDLLAGMTRSWHHLTSGRAWVAGTAACGLAGWLRSVDLTVSATAGWHPHLHVAVVLDGHRDTDDGQLAAWMTDRWRAACEHAGLRVPSRRRGVDVRDVGDSTAGYVLRIATEVVRSDIKAGHGGAYAPLQLLDLAGTPSEAWARARFREYERAVHGRHAMASSRSLRPWLTAVDTTDHPDPVTDPADGADGADSADRLVAVLQPEQWQALRHSPAGLSNLLALLDTGRHDQAADLLAELEHADTNTEEV